ncbi:thermonuclease family protein [Rummeliibacillus stabekisii]|uniref:thermonuclease family protein n=1 Tax=Rummeliibacillus stabekisii TaxID=241244 RepID=UPI00203DCAE2|nr:thermonuclease family protein [Rummeliibacillus stabekisii]MCM3318018.1 thermonuclease family protein [Rummeliibacillus stabekisii]
MRSPKILFVFSLVSLLLLSACSGGDIANKISEERQKELSESASKSVDTVIKEVTNSNEVEKFLNNPKEKLKAVLMNDQNKSTSIAAVTYKSNYDGDTYTFIANKDFKLGISPSTRRYISWKKGETITVRHLLIDTTEMKDKMTGSQQPYASEAKAYSEQLLKRAKKIELIFDAGDKLDKYDRKLAYVRIDGQLLGTKLLQSGLAKIRYVNEPNTKYLSTFKKAEKKAKAKSVNLWSVHY